jgi:hypothetical protein
MKKFWIIMLSLGLIAAFSMPAAATDVKLGGSYFVAGYLESNHAVRENAPSMAYYGQRLRFEPVFKVAEGLTFNLRVDAMERVWGMSAIGSEAANTNGSVNYNSGTFSARNKRDEQNIQFRRGWVEFLTGIGQFNVGYAADGTWGTDFGDPSTEGPSIVYITKAGPVVLLAVYEKQGEGRLTPQAAGNFAVDSDQDKYCASGLYFWDKGQAGLLWCNIRGALARPATNSILNIYAYEAYFKTTLGPVYLEGEYQFWNGKMAQFDDNVVGTDVDLDTMQWYLMAKYTMGPAYVGVQYAHADGDDPGSTNKYEGTVSAGNTWQPTLILFNDWTNRWAGDMGTYGTTGFQFFNADLYQVFGGYDPMPKLGIKASYTYASADQKPTATWVDDVYGSEFDLTVTYKIYDNLQYMIGFGYLWAGDFYKGTNSANKIDDNYLLMHQLTLSF